MRGAGPLRWTAGETRIELRQANGAYARGWWVWADGVRVGRVHRQPGPDGVAWWNHLPRIYRTPDPGFATRQEAAESMVRHAFLRRVARP